LCRHCRCACRGRGAGAAVALAGRPTRSACSAPCVRLVTVRGGCLSCAQCHGCGCNWRQPASEDDELPKCPQWCVTRTNARTHVLPAAHRPPWPAVAMLCTRSRTTGRAHADTGRTHARTHARTHTCTHARTRRAHNPTRARARETARGNLSNACLWASRRVLPDPTYPPRR
jgi:hypothetical protein